MASTPMFLTLVVLILLNVYHPSLADTEQNISETTDVCDQGLLKTCGYYTCNISYQYCDEGFVKSQCSLCEEICAPVRIGTRQELYQRCYERCPVYMERRTCRSEIGNVPTETSYSTTAGCPGDAQSHSLVLGVVVVVLVILLIIFACIIIYLVCRLHKHNVYKKQYSSDSETGFTPEHSDEKSTDKLLQHSSSQPNPAWDLTNKSSCSNSTQTYGEMVNKSTQTTNTEHISNSPPDQEEKTTFGLMTDDTTPMILDDNNGERVHDQVSTSDRHDYVPTPAKTTTSNGVSENTIPKTVDDDDTGGPVVSPPPPRNEEYSQMSGFSLHSDNQAFVSIHQPRSAGSIDLLNSRKHDDRLIRPRPCRDSGVASSENLTNISSPT